MRITIDRNSEIPLRQQLRGAIEHEIAFGGAAAGDPLPSVRDLAERLGVAPATVSKVYAGLKSDGLIATRTGSGTYVAGSAFTRIAECREMPRLRRDIDAVIDLALSAGCAPASVMSLVHARMLHRLGPGRRKHVVMLGLFADATASYARCVEDQVGHLAALEPVTLDVLSADPELRERVRRADLVLTFPNLEEDIGRLLPGVPVLTLRFIPSAATRMALAAIDPMRRVGAVSRFADFLPILNLGVRRFAPHLQNVAAFALDDPALPAALADCEVLVLSTGADAAAAHARRDVPRIEYRHVPDPGEIERYVIPRLLGPDLASSSSIKEAS